MHEMIASSTHDQDIEPEFDMPFTIHPDSSITTCNVTFLSSAEYRTRDEVTLDGQHFEDTAWRPVTGFSGQQGYDGPIMHPSEVFAGTVVHELRQRAITGGVPSTYVLTAVQGGTDLDQDLPEAEYVGWIILRHAVRDELLADVHVTALEGGIGYWAEVLDYSPSHHTARLREQDETTVHEVTAATMDKGLRRIATSDHPLVATSLERTIRWSHEHDEMHPNFDALCADAVTQVALFGKIVYG